MSSASDATAIEITDLDLLPPAVRQAVLDLQAQVAHLSELTAAQEVVIADPSMTVAAIDRLVHHSTIIEMNGESYRKRSAAARINADDYDPPNGAPDRPS